LHITATAPEGGEETATRRLHAPRLPPGLPPIEVRVSRPEVMEPGVTLVPCTRFGPGGPEDDFGLLLALDAAGEIVWIYRADHPVGEARPVASGHLVYLSGRDGRLVEIDGLGREITRWHTTGTPKPALGTSNATGTSNASGTSNATDPTGAPDADRAIPVDVDTFHHDWVELPNGRFLVLGTELYRAASFPSSETDPDAPRRPATLISDTLVELSRDGVVHRTWSLRDFVDPDRIGYGSLSTGFWKETYASRLDPPGFDVFHANGLAFDEATRTAIVSLRHQDAILAVDLERESLRWILAPPAGWREPFASKRLRPIGDLAWPYHPHAPKLTARGTLLLFDNGNHRASPFDAPMAAAQSWSRAVEFRVDASAGTVEEVWSWGGAGEGRFFSPFLGDVDPLPGTGNRLVTDGGRIRGPDGSPSASIGRGHHFARILEVTGDTEPEVVFEVVLDEPGRGWSVYRAERLPEIPAVPAVLASSQEISQEESKD